jgi:hypothetical protein
VRTVCMRIRRVPCSTSNECCNTLTTKLDKIEFSVGGWQQDPVRLWPAMHVCLGMTHAVTHASVIVPVGGAGYCCVDCRTMQEGMHACSRRSSAHMQHPKSCAHMQHPKSCAHMQHLKSCVHMQHPKS